MRKELWFYCGIADSTLTWELLLSPKSVISFEFGYLREIIKNIKSTSSCIGQPDNVKHSP